MLRSAEFPDSLNELSGPPAVLFYRSDSRPIEIVIRFGTGLTDDSRQGCRNASRIEPFATAYSPTTFCARPQTPGQRLDRGFSRLRFGF